ncbi:myelin protein zero-like protein 1 [Trachemys scripta elegans]|uniref:myelin protein zero-like protein 1 n=1 Tax=Trachemys scripta elegans TaxID=31138 RepID=UPI001555CF7F|nr:myelin protein zero-like protein 1 [Trachemys scripta elegans]
MLHLDQNNLLLWHLVFTGFPGILRMRMAAVCAPSHVNLMQLFGPFPALEILLGQRLGSEAERSKRLLRTRILASKCCLSRVEIKVGLQDTCKMPKAVPTGYIFTLLVLQWQYAIMPFFDILFFNCTYLKPYWCLIVVVWGVSPRGKELYMCHYGKGVEEGFEGRMIVVEPASERREGLVTDIIAVEVKKARFLENLASLKNFDIIAYNLPAFPTGMVVAIAIGVTLVVLLLIAVIVCVVRKKNSKKHYSGCSTSESLMSPVKQAPRKSPSDTEGLVNHVPARLHQGPVIYAQLDHSGGQHSDKINKSESVVYADIRKN